MMEAGWRLFVEVKVAELVLGDGGKKGRGEYAV